MFEKTCSVRVENLKIVYKIKSSAFFGQLTYSITNFLFVYFVSDFIFVKLVAKHLLNTIAMMMRQSKIFLVFTMAYA
jgi:hypothetical protein